MSDTGNRRRRCQIPAPRHCRGSTCSSVATFFCSDLCLSKKNLFLLETRNMIKNSFSNYPSPPGGSVLTLSVLPFSLSSWPFSQDSKLTLTHCTILWYEVVLPESTPGIIWTPILKWMNLQRAHLNCIKRFKLVWKHCCAAESLQQWKAHPSASSSGEKPQIPAHRLTRQHCVADQMTTSER